jgi:hypothetical protein
MAAQTTIGSQLSDVGSPISVTNASTFSYVELAHPARAAGTVNEVSFSWTQSCPVGALKIAFLRPVEGSATTFTVTSLRGPFGTVAGRSVWPLVPPVVLQKGDVIAALQLQPYSQCGSVQIQHTAGSTGFNVITASDISTSPTIGNTAFAENGVDFGLFAYDSDPVLARVLPAAGAVQGATAFFRTSLQLLNPTGSTISGKLVFHPQGQPSSFADPALSFTLDPGQLTSYPDVVASMNTSGLGSLDIVTNEGVPPLATARVFSDGGAAGTSGFSEEGLSPDNALDSSRRGVLFIPGDLTNFRMNIGLRTLETGATLNVSVYDTNGHVVNSKSGLAYPANYFIQQTAADFAGVQTLPAGGWILITANNPTKAFIYSSVIDNHTSDSTYHLADVK